MEYAGKTRADLWRDIYANITNETKITVTAGNVAPGDRFLLFNAWRQKTVLSFVMSVPVVVFFDGDEPIRLEDCPTEFLQTIVKNI